MEAAEGDHSFTMMIADQLGDSPRQTGAAMREMKRRRLTDLGGEFDNVLCQNQHVQQAATQAARSAATTAYLPNEVLKSILPTTARSVRDDDIKSRANAKTMR